VQVGGHPVSGIDRHRAAVIVSYAGMDGSLWIGECHKQCRLAPSLVIEGDLSVMRRWQFVSMPPPVAQSAVGIRSNLYAPVLYLAGIDQTVTIARS